MAVLILTWEDLFLVLYLLKKLCFACFPLVQYFEVFKCSFSKDSLALSKLSVPKKLMSTAVIQYVISPGHVDHNQSNTPLPVVMTTASIFRAQNTETNTENLYLDVTYISLSRQLTQLLSVDLGGRRPGSFGPSCISRPPPVGRSQSSSELQLSSRNGSSSSEKKIMISPLAKEKAKRFSFDSVGMKQNFCAKGSGAEIALLVSEASPLTPRRQLNESEPTNSPETIRRDNIDGCESEKDSSDIGERTNAGFSGDEDEDTCVFRSEDFLNTSNCSSNKVETAKDGQIGDPTNNAMLNTTLCKTRDAKDELESNENDTTMDQNGDLALNLKSVNGSLGTKSPGVSDHLVATVDQGPTVSGLNDSPEVGTPGIGRDQFSVPNQDDTTVLRSDPILESATEGVEIPLKKLASNTVLDDNDNFLSPKVVEESNLADKNSEKVHSMEETGATASKDEEKVNLLDRTLDSVIHDTRVEAKALVFNEVSAEDAPAYKRKLQRKKDKKKNDKIEKTFFV